MVAEGTASPGLSPEEFLMALVPNTIDGKLSFYHTHAAQWVTKAVAIGLTSSQATAFKTLVDAVAEGKSVADAARDLSKQRTAEQNSGLDVMSQQGAAIIEQIRAYAAANNDPQVLMDAQIPPISPPTPLGPPIVPTTINAVMNASGVVSVKWKAAPPSPQYYQLQRQLNGTGDYVILATQNGKEYSDAALPTGTTSAIYRVFGYRGAVLSNTFASIAMTFGLGMTGGGGRGRR